MKLIFLILVVLLAGCVSPQGVQVAPQSYVGPIATSPTDAQQQGILNVYSYGAYWLAGVSMTAIICMAVCVGFATKRPHPKKVKRA